MFLTCNGRTDNLLKLRTVPVSVTSVQFASANESTSMLDITEAWLANDCATVFGNNESQSLNCRFSNEITDHADFFCFGAVKSVSFIIIHDQSSSSEIVNVSLQLVLTDVALSTTTSYMAQTFSVTYVNSPSATVVSANNGNQIPRYSPRGIICMLMKKLLTHIYLFTDIVLETLDMWLDYHFCLDLFRAM